MTCRSLSVRKRWRCLYVFHTLCKSALCAKNNPNLVCINHDTRPPTCLTLIVLFYLKQNQTGSLLMTDPPEPCNVSLAGPVQGFVCVIDAPSEARQSDASA